MKIRVTRDGRSIEGVVVSIRGEDTMEVRADSGETILVGKDDSVEVIRTEEPPITSPQPPIEAELVMGEAQVQSQSDVGAVVMSDIGGIDSFHISTEIETVPPIGNGVRPGATDHEPESAPAPEPDPEPQCYVVKPQGERRPTTYHSRLDCGKVKKRETMGLDEEQAKFLGLTLCSFCLKKDSQISFSEALVAELDGHGLTEPDVQAALDALAEKYGFTIRPDAVDRIADSD